jgi:hypothetical protein
MVRIMNLFKCLMKLSPYNTMAIYNPKLLLAKEKCTYIIATFASFQNQPLSTNINLVPTNSEME